MSEERRESLIKSPTLMRGPSLRAARLPILLIPGFLFLTVLFGYDFLGNWLLNYMKPVVEAGTRTLLNALGAGRISRASSWGEFINSIEVGTCIKAADIGLFAMGTFLCVLAFYFLANPKRLTPLKWGAICLAGFAYALFLNVVRFTSGLMIIKVLRSWYVDPDVAGSYAHFAAAQLGWFVYGVGFFIFFRLLLGKPFAPSRSKSSTPR